MAGYTREQTLRMLRIQPRQLLAWERARLIAASQSYSFQELGQLRKLRDLCAMHISASSISASVEAMRQVSGAADPLIEASAVCNGPRLTFRYSGAMMEPIARQFVFDFECNPRPRQSIAPPLAGFPMDVGAMFSDAVQLEASGHCAQATVIYRAILDAEPRHAPTCINLGTLAYNERKFVQAEELYRRAADSDPGYALAWFDLGNALDELKRLPQAIEAYQTAIRLTPRYADAHYNLALAFERIGERRKALRHWTAYLKLDSVGPWANHARGQARLILDREKLSIVHRSARYSAAKPMRPVGQLHLASPAAV